MKKNLISVLILALLFVNVILTGIMMFSTLGSVKKTSALVTDIATVLNIELEGPKEEETETEETVQMADTDIHDIPEMTILLKKGEDGAAHYCVLNSSIMMNKNHEDYATYSTMIPTQDSAIMSIINEVVSKHTMDEIQGDTESLKNEILTRIQADYGSTFIYKVAFSNIILQ